MADVLSPSRWKSTLNEKENADAKAVDDLTKAIDKYDKLEPKAKNDPQPFLDVVKEVVESAKTACTKNPKKEKLLKVLNAMISEAGKERVRGERLLQEKNERDREKPEEDEEGDGDERARLTERLVMVKRLDPDRAKGFVLALGGKVHGLVIGKKADVGAALMKRAKGMRDGNGRIFTGKVFGEKGRYVFEMAEKPPGGLAKAIKKAAAAHTALPPLRVVVRGLGVEFDDENDKDDLADLGPIPQDDDERGPQTAAPASAESETARRLEAVSSRASAVIARGGPNAREVELAFKGAQVFQKGGKFDRALELLDRLDEALQRIEGEARAAEAAAPADEPPPAEAFQKSLRAWEAAQKKVRTDLDRLVTTMRDRFEDEPEYDEVDAAAGEIVETLDVFDDALAVAIGAALQAGPGDRPARHRQVKGVLMRYRSELEASPLIKDLDSNPFAPVAIHKTLNDTLVALGKSLGA
jgi:hypothetical protein